jgi:hypothetical protein
MRPWLTTSDLANRWKTSERHVERKRVDGTGPRYARFGEDKAVRYPPEEVEAWEAAQLVSSTSEEVAAGRRSHKVTEPKLAKPLRSGEKPKLPRPVRKPKAQIEPRVE